MLLNDEQESNEEKLLQTPVRQTVVSTLQNTPDTLSPSSVIKTPTTNRRLSNGKQRSTVLNSPGPITPFEKRSSKCVSQFVFNKHILDSMVGQRSEAESEDDLIKRNPFAEMVFYSEKASRERACEDRHSKSVKCCARVNDVPIQYL